METLSNDLQSGKGPICDLRTILAPRIQSISNRFSLALITKVLWWCDVAEFVKPDSGGLKGFKRFTKFLKGITFPAWAVPYLMYATVYYDGLSMMSQI